MITVSKIACILACGVVLGVSLSDQTTWARDEIKVFHPVPRIGGQAGQPYDHAKHDYGSLQARERIGGQPGERIGGQAGQPYDHMKPEYESGLHARARIGGQAGERNGLIRLE